MNLARCVVPLLLLVRTIPASADVLTDMFPADTKVVIGIRVHNIVTSELAKGFMAQAKAQAQAQAQLLGAADWLKMASAFGFDPLQDVDEVLLATNGSGQKAPALIVVTGRFDLARLSEGAKRYHDIAILGGANPGEGVIALLNASTALAGDVELIHAAIDHQGSGAKIGAALNTRIASLRERYDIWGLGETPKGFTAPTPETKALEAIDRFQFGVQMSKGLEIGAEIHARSSKEADKLKSSLQMIAALVKSQQPSKNGGKFDLQVEGGTIKIAIVVPEEELKKAMQSGMTMTPATPRLAAGPPVISGGDAVASNAPATRTPATQVTDHDGNTVIFRLPGKK